MTGRTGDCCCQTQTVGLRFQSARGWFLGAKFVDPLPGGDSWQHQVSFLGRPHRLVTVHSIRGRPTVQNSIPNLTKSKLEPLPNSQKNIASVPSNPKESFPTLAWHSQPGGKELMGCYLGSGDASCPYHLVQIIPWGCKWQEFFPNLYPLWN